LSGKPNEEFKKLIANSNAKRGSVIAKVTWTNPDYYRKFNPVKDTIPANPTWRPLASRPEALEKWRVARSGKPTTQKRVHGQAFSEEEDADKDIASQEGEDKENSDPLSCVTNFVPAKKRLTTAAYKGSSSLRKEKDLGDGGRAVSSGKAASGKGKGKKLPLFGSELSQ